MTEPWPRSQSVTLGLTSDLDVLRVALFPGSFRAGFTESRRSVRSGASKRMGPRPPLFGTRRPL